MKGYGFLLVIAVAACKHPKLVHQTEPFPLQKIDQTLTEVDSQALRTIRPYADSLKGKMSRVVAHSQVELTHRRPEGLLGNFLTDLLLQYTRLTLFPKEPLCVLLNGGGLRAPLPKGDITVGRIFETLPFENALTVLKLSAQQFDTVVMRTLEKKGEPVSNIRIKSYPGGQSWQLLNTEGRPEFVYLATSDYLADGNDGYPVLKRALERFDTGMNLREVILLQLQQIQRNNVSIAPEIEGRTTIE